MFSPHHSYSYDSVSHSVVRHGRELRAQCSLSPSPSFGLMTWMADDREAAVSATQFGFNDLLVKRSGVEISVTDYGHYFLESLTLTCTRCWQLGRLDRTNAWMRYFTYIQSNTLNLDMMNATTLLRPIRDADLYLNHLCRLGSTEQLRGCYILLIFNPIHWV